MSYDVIVIGRYRRADKRRTAGTYRRQMGSSWSGTGRGGLTHTFPERRRLLGYWELLQQVGPGPHPLRLPLGGELGGTVCRTPTTRFGCRPRPQAWLSDPDRYERETWSPHSPGVQSHSSLLQRISPRVAGGRPWASFRMVPQPVASFRWSGSTRAPDNSHRNHEGVPGCPLPLPRAQRRPGQPGGRPDLPPSRSAFAVHAR